MFRNVNSTGDIQHLQNYLHKLVTWSEKLQMFLYVGKYKCLHTGKGNLDVNNNMENTVLGTIIKLKGFKSATKC